MWLLEHVRVSNGKSTMGLLVRSLQFTRQKSVLILETRHDFLTSLTENKIRMYHASSFTISSIQNFVKIKPWSVRDSYFDLYLFF
jgi:hypothetical protein